MTQLSIRLVIIMHVIVQTNIHRIWNIIGCKPRSDRPKGVDFRLKGGDNHGRGSVIVYVLYVGAEADHSLSCPGRKKFSDESGKADLIYLIRNDNARVGRQFNLMADKSEGLTQAGMAILNQSIKAFFYRLLGSQVNVRSSILGVTGSSK